MLKTALLGTERQPLSPALRQRAEELQLDLAQEDAALLLSLVAVENRLQKAAAIFPVLDANLRPQPLPSEPNALNQRAVQLLNRLTTWATDKKLDGLVKHNFSLLERSSTVLPASLLVSTLDNFKNKPEMWALVANIVGVRGQWLAAQNDEWLYAKREINDEIWETGSAAERRNVLRIMRHRDPKRAFDWLQTTYEADSSEAKSSFLKIMIEKPLSEELAFYEKIVANASRKDLKELALKAVLELQTQKPTVVKVVFNDNDWAHQIDTIRSINALPFDENTRLNKDLIAALLKRMSSQSGYLVPWEAKPFEVLLYKTVASAKQPKQCLADLTATSWEFNHDTAWLFGSIAQAKRVLQQRTELEELI